MGSPNTEAGWVDDAPLLAAWLAFATADVAPFTIPAHKRRGGELHPSLARLLDADVPLYGGADTVKLDAGVLADAEGRAAQLWGADVCRFSTGGSTHANQAACLALGRPGDTVIVGRNAHRSVIGGLVLADLRPVWLPVTTTPSTGEPTGVEIDDVRAALDGHPGCAGVIVTDPTYQGTRCDLAAVVAVAHARGVPVMVDQAWGAHLGMTVPYPPHALQCGADLMVTSAHKMLPAFSQAALVLARTGRIDAERVDRAFETTHTTSPSAAILASIDASRALLAHEAGRDMLRRLADLVAAARQRLRAAGLVVPGPDDHPPGRFDPAKLVVRFGLAGRDGLHAERVLAERGVPVEMADRDTLVAQVGMTDDEATVDRLVAGVLASLAGAPSASRTPVVTPAPPAPQRCTPREAFFARYEAVPRDRAAGRVCAELVAPYPPGVPVLVPGEEVTVEALEALTTAAAAGNRIAYAADPTLATVRVVAD